MKQRLLRVKSIPLFLLLFVGCAPPNSPTITDPSIAVREQPILGGTLDTGDPEVFALFHWRYGGPFCTATRIGERTLLSASHCVDPSIIGIDVTTAVATNDPSGSDQDGIAIVAFATHPDWDPKTLANDVSLLLLAEAPSGASKPWAFMDVSAHAPDELRLVGYGQTATGSDGHKREVTVGGIVMKEKLLQWDQTSGKGACHGDSGGPAFFTFPDGTERTIGITSHALDWRDCNGGAVYTRVDAYKPFITEWLEEHETPTCAFDGMCKKTGCQSPDIDCSCAADGVCSAKCPTQLDDPDCPRNCLENGVCADQRDVACAVPDPDCKATGKACGSTLECALRACIEDGQNPQAYCSRTCDAPADCPVDYECRGKYCRKKRLPEVAIGAACTVGKNVCEDGACIDGKCVARCKTSADCSENAACTGTDSGEFYCLPLPRPALAPATTPTPEASDETNKPNKGCAAADGAVGSYAILLLAALLRRRPKEDAPAAR